MTKAVRKAIMLGRLGNGLGGSNSNGSSDAVVITKDSEAEADEEETSLSRVQKKSAQMGAAIKQLRVQVKQ